MPMMPATSVGQISIDGIWAAAWPITGPASQAPNAGPASKPTDEAAPSSTKRRLRSTTLLMSAM